MVGGGDQILEQRVLGFGPPCVPANFDENRSLAVVGHLQTKWRLGGENTVKQFNSLLACCTQPGRKTAIIAIDMIYLL